MKPFFHNTLVVSGAALAGLLLAVDLPTACAQNYTPHLQAIQKAQEGKPRDALEALRPLLIEEKTPAEVFWNAGVYSYQSGEMSLASAYFEEAVRKGLWRLDALEWIRKTRGQVERSAQSVEPQLFKDLVMLVFPLPFGWILFVSGLLAALSLLGKARTLTGVLCGLLLLVAVFIRVLPASEVGFVHNAEATLFAGAGESFPQVARLKKGDRVPVMKRQAEWVQVETQAGTKLWGLSQDFLVIR